MGMGDEGSENITPPLLPPVASAKVRKKERKRLWRPNVEPATRMALMVEKLRGGIVRRVGREFGVTPVQCTAILKSATDGEWREAREILQKQVRDGVGNKLNEVYELYYQAIKRLCVKAEEIAMKAEGAIQLAKLLEAMTKVYQTFRGTPLPLPLIGNMDDKTVQQEALCALVEGIRRSDAEFVEMGLKLTRSDYRAADRGGRGDVGLYERMAATGKTDGELEEEQEQYLVNMPKGKRAG